MSSLSAPRIQFAQRNFRFTPPPNGHEVQSVEIAIDIHDNWKPIPMKREPDGAYTCSVPLPIKPFHYYFIVDGRTHVLDPHAAGKVRGSDNLYVSRGDARQM